ncbi:MAG TPA: O-antigen ligase family protein [Thermoanaerobaculia bacterium]|nr:O-antigen ligase family protein [Thermoanaerobaculia bacterium]
MPERPPRAVAATFWLYAGHLYTLFGIALSNLFAGLAVLAAPFAWRAKRRAAGSTPAPDPDLDGPRRLLLAALAVYVLGLLVAVAASPQPAVSAGALSELFTLALVPVALLVAVGEERVRVVVDGMTAVGGLVAAMGLVQLLGGFGGIDRRIRGPFSHWMTFSGFLLLCGMLLAGVLLFGAHRRRGGWRSPRLWWRLAALAAILAAILGSLTRGAWLGLAAGIVFLVALRAPRWLAALPVAAVVFFLLAPLPIVARATSTVDPLNPSNYDRLAMADAGLRMVAERPLVGIGPELVEERYPIYRHPSGYRLWVPHLHNSFLQVAAERGLPSLAALLALMVASFTAAWRLYRREGRKRGPRADLWMGALGALVAFNVAGLFEHNWGDTEVQRLALFVVVMPFLLGGGWRWGDGEGI